ncbi:hypothetical protein AVEN_245875-1 [Araneus ventricosus]|uniref:Uncharacterized protein n=1 Tax=Araneus ventricosus TaxID=182803 RepID=A0A4Y2HM78_ARAVE|nr:hypothetical protein AVEN_245875-1 [Araneus ventricosus]
MSNEIRLVILKSRTTPARGHLALALQQVQYRTDLQLNQVSNRESSDPGRDFTTGPSRPMVKAKRYCSKMHNWLSSPFDEANHETCHVA